MLVSREFCAYARTNAVWERHKRRVLEEIPLLGDLFANHTTWYFFNTFLMGDIIQKTATTTSEIQQKVLFCYLKYAFSDRPDIKISVSRQSSPKPHVLVSLWSLNNVERKRNMKWESEKSNLWCGSGGEASMLFYSVNCFILDKQELQSMIRMKAIQRMRIGYALEYLWI
jgi:hypothetical protein